MQKGIKINKYNVLTLIHVFLSVVVYFVERKKYVLGLSLPASTGVLTEEIKPVWDEIIFMNLTSQRITAILSILSLVYLLYFVYILGRKIDHSISLILKSAIVYTMVMVIIGVIANFTGVSGYFNSIVLFSSSLTPILMIIIIESIRGFFMKLKGI